MTICLMTLTNFRPNINRTPFLNELSVPEILRILERRGVQIKPGYPSSASWPSSTFPGVSLWSWSWGANVSIDPTSSNPSDDSDADSEDDDSSIDLSMPSTLSLGRNKSKPPKTPMDPETVKKILESDVAWLRRLLIVTLPIHGVRSIPRGCGKWMASYIAAEKDSTRTRITRMELTSMSWYA
jgi:hypothetical protein